MTHHIVNVTPRTGGGWWFIFGDREVIVERLRDVDDTCRFILQNSIGSSAMDDTFDVRIGGRIHPTPPGPAPAPFINTRGHQRGTRGRHPVEHDQPRKHRS